MTIEQVKLLLLFAPLLLLWGMIIYDVMTDLKSDIEYHYEKRRR